LKKYSVSGNITDFSWFVSSSQKMNKGLKYIAKRAGISKGFAYASSTAHLCHHYYVIERRAY
jgi:hypothetical protein